MRYVHTLIALLCLSPLPALAQAQPPRPVAQVAMLPVAEQGRDDVVALVKAHWGPYFQTQHPQGFGREALRVGRFDLDGDGLAELLVLLDKPDWEAEHGFPLVVAVWTDKGWNAVGWAWGDQDTVFVTDEIRDGWRTIDTGTQFLYWDKGLYSRVDKN